MVLKFIELRIMLVETTHLTQVELNSLPVLYFACRRKVIHLCFITSPGKIIFAVLELWLSPLQWILKW